MHLLASSLVAIAAVAAALPAQSFVSYESGPVAPVCVSDDGSRLIVADTAGGRLCVFDVRDAASPFLICEVPVGVDPVAVRARSRDEVWVCNQVSDTVSVVDVEARRVTATLRVVDEPSDVVFAGGKAFVTAATRDQVYVFDAATRAPLGVVEVFGKDPRALAVSPDGSKVYAVVQRSGNGTTILPADLAPLPPPPTNGALPLAPEQGLIVRADDPAYSSHFVYSLPDHDVAEIDVASQTVTRYFDAVGTTNTGIAVHPATGELWVANTDARNLVRFEPNLRGHAIDSRVTRITTGATPTVTPIDLNPGLDYATLPNPAALATALSEPFGVAIDASQGRVYVAAHGTDRVGVLDLAGNVLDRIEVGSTPGAAVDTRSKRGPRGLAVHPTADVLYVLNRLSDTLVIVDTQTHAVLGERPIATVDPVPQWLREGRNFLYDAKLSGNGTMSCAACHIDGDLDGIAWDLGDPGGVIEPAPPQPFPFNIGLTGFHPMKGPMTTQTLRGIGGTGVLHWRGDRADFQAFNPAFDKLMGGSELAASDMNAFAAAVDAVRLAPNPNQLLDRGLRTTPAGNNEAAGAIAYQVNVGAGQLPGFLSCNTCHTLPTGTNGLVINSASIQEPQQMKVAQLRNMYRKVGFRNEPGPQKSGFGYTHDGALDTLESFLQLPPFNPWPAADMDDIATFLMSLDTGTAPAVGYQFVLDQANASSTAVAADAALLTSRAAAGDLDLTAHGAVDGVETGLLYVPSALHFVTDRSGVGPFTTAQLQGKALAGAAQLAFTAVAPGTGERLARDRDGDAALDGDEAAWSYGAASVGCNGAPLLFANSEPFVGNDDFGFAVHDAQPATVGVLALALGAASIPVLGIDVLVDPATASLAMIVSDATGDARHAFPLPDDPGIVGATVYAQALWIDPCGAEYWASSAGVGFTVQP